MMTPDEIKAVAEQTAEILAKQIDVKHSESHEQLDKIMPDLKRLADAFTTVEKSLWRTIGKVVKIAAFAWLIYMFGGNLGGIRDKILELLK